MHYGELEQRELSHAEINTIFFLSDTGSIFLIFCFKNLFLNGFFFHFFLPQHYRTSYNGPKSQANCVPSTYWGNLSLAAILKTWGKHPIAEEPSLSGLWL